jgi:hypothetical protein
MRSRTALTQLGKLVAVDLARGEVSDGVRSVGEALASSPSSLIEIIELIAAESRKKRRNEDLVNAFAFMLGEALVVLRYGVERGHKDAIESVAAIRSLVQGLARDGRLDPVTLLLVLRQFTGAKLELGTELQAAMASTVESHAASVSADAAGIDGLLKELSRDYGGDVFALQAGLSEQAAPFPEERRAMMAAVMLAACGFR